MGQPPYERRLLPARSPRSGRFSKDGVYLTSYGSEALVRMPTARLEQPKVAIDLRNGERIPIEEVTTKWLREIP